MASSVRRYARVDAPAIGGLSTSEASVTTTGATPDSHALLTDGASVQLRDVRPADRDEIRDLQNTLSPASMHLRFAGTGRDLGSQIADRMCREPGPDHGALAALSGGHIIGVASYQRNRPGDQADLALAVRDDMHGRGIATLLLEHLVPRARANGIARLVADVLTGNNLMLKVFTDAGLRVERTLVDGVPHYTIPLAEDGNGYLDPVADRERRADMASLAAAFRPRSIVVVGARRRPGGIGRAVLDRLLASGYTGSVYVVHPRESQLDGMTAYPSAEDLPEAPDLAVVAVPTARALDVARSCGRRGAKVLLMLSSGFDDESGAMLRTICRRYGMRLIGPNCLGILSTDPELPFDVTFADSPAQPGAVGVVTQSAGAGAAVLNRLAPAEVGTSLFVSVGDKYDVSANDLMMWWESDPRTKVAVVYVDSFGNPRKFGRTARRLSLHMPVLTVLGGTPAAAQGAGTAQPATAAAALTPRRALFAQAGVVAVDTLGELVGATAVLTHQSAPAGRRVAVLSNVAGLGALVADACVDAGLDLANLSATVREELGAVLPDGATVANPVDATDRTDGETLARAASLVAGSGAVDAVIVAIAPTARGNLRDGLGSLRTPAAVTTIAVDLAQRQPVAAISATDEVVPTFIYPEHATRALAHAWRYRAWLSRPPGTSPVLPGVDRDSALSIVREFLANRPDGGWMPYGLANALLSRYRIPHPATITAGTADRAVIAAQTLGFPVVVKAAGPDLARGTGRDAIRPGIADAYAVRAAVEDLTRSLDAPLAELVVQPMVEAGLELSIGISQDEVFGPLVEFGRAGTTAQAPRAARLTPLTSRDAAELVGSIRPVPQPRRRRGPPPVALDALTDLLLRVSQLADDLPEIAELELDPVIARPDGARAVDVRIRLVPREPHEPYLRLR